MEQPVRWRRWVVVVAAGELGGFAVPAVVGIAVRDMSAGTQLVVMPAAALVEGALLGLAQAALLRRAVAGFAPRAWISATSLAAALAWFIGMLPSTTNATWSTWPTAEVAVGAAVLGTVLLASIGTAQALVLPRGVRGRWAWVGWTALGWCAGLTAFTVVTTPLWQPGQAVWLLFAIGVAGGVVMAVVMAAVTGVGAVHLVERARGGRTDSTFAPGRHVVSTLLGTRVYDASGGLLGRVRDLVADLAVDLDRPPVTHVLIAAPRGRRLAAPFDALAQRVGGDGLELARDPEPRAALGPSELLVRRDVLDSPVILTEPPGRSRVSDVVVEIGPAGAWVVGVDLSPSGVVHRLLPGASSDRVSRVVPLSRVHLVSARGHAAQLAIPDSTVLALPADGMAEVLTRVSVTHARDIIQAADQQVREDAVRLLHPHVRGRVTGTEGPPRRLRRFSGWRLHRPGTHPPRGDGG